jgi:ATP-dependent exoDNAse (exonuclease V) beta subunit
MFRKGEASSHIVEIKPRLVKAWASSVKTDCTQAVSHCILAHKSSHRKMKPYYRIKAEGIGIVLLRKRKIAKALRRWLREKGLSYESDFYIQ